MADDRDLITVMEYLTVSERDTVTGIFNAQKIPYVVSGHGPSTRYHSYYYLIKVRKRDYQTAKLVANRHRAKVFVNSRKCPQCQTLGFVEIEKRNWWQKIFYAGTTLVQCKKCQHKFVI